MSFFTARGPRLALWLCAALWFAFNLSRLLFDDADFEVLLAAARRWLQGAALYVSEDNAFTYPPPLAMLLAPLALLPQAAGRIAFYLLSCAALWLGVRLLHREVLPPQTPRRALIIAAALIGSLRFAQAVFDNQQMDGLVFCAVLAGAALWTRGRELWGAGCWALAAGLKANPAFLVLLPLFRGRWRAAGIFAAALAALLLAPDLLRPEFRAAPGAAFSMPKRVSEPGGEIERFLLLPPGGRGHLGDFLRFNFATPGGQRHGGEARAEAEDSAWWAAMQSGYLNQSLTRIALRWLPFATGAGAFLFWCAAFGAALLLLCLLRRPAPFPLALLGYGAFVLIGPVSSKPHFIAFYGLLLWCWADLLRPARISRAGLAVLLPATLLMGLTARGLVGSAASSALASFGHIGLCALGVWSYAFLRLFRESQRRVQFLAMRRGLAS
ncbi:MAG: glycosyltransferase family 87 protein [Deltaproteobacteria bacterium]|nr:glycosyltransferase family 87 protein [Deltaproteobacteria bacterium]MDD9872417.1 glycosyltransferase family 87 protein [Deltaproteobacteria bacterium]